MIDQEITFKLSSLVSLLVNRNFDEASHFLFDQSAGSESIKNAIENYEFGDGKNTLQLTMPPLNGFLKKNIYPQVIKSDCTAIATWILEFDLWFNNRPSDLTLLCVIEESAHEHFDLLISDIRVM